MPTYLPRPQADTQPVRSRVYYQKIAAFQFILLIRDFKFQTRQLMTLFVCVPHYLFSQGRCTRENCKYLHPPAHLKTQLEINGRNNLIQQKTAAAMLAQQMQFIIPGTTMQPVVSFSLVAAGIDWLTIKIAVLLCLTVKSLFLLKNKYRSSCISSVLYYCIFVFKCFYVIELLR